MKCRVLLPILLVAVLIKSNAQLSGLQFKLYSGGNSLSLDQTYPLDSAGAYFQLESFRFYISKIQIHQDNQMVFEEPQSYHLLDASDSSSLFIPIISSSIKPASQLRFLLGIDSLTNAGGLGSKDLDPINGMYWAWQSGYIHVKAEGKFISSDKTIPFQYHLGGFLSNQLATAAIELAIPSHALIPIEVDVKPWLSEMKKSGLTKMMSPSADAVKSTQHLATCFKISKPQLK